MTHVEEDFVLCWLIHVYLVFPSADEMSGMIWRIPKSHEIREATIGEQITLTCILRGRGGSSLNESKLFQWFYYNEPIISRSQFGATMVSGVDYISDTAFTSLRPDENPGPCTFRYAISHFRIYSIHHFGVYTCQYDDGTTTTSRHFYLKDSSKKDKGW